MTDIIDFSQRTKIILPTKDDPEMGDVAGYLTRMAAQNDIAKFSQAVVYMDSDETVRFSYHGYSKMELLWVSEQLRKYALQGHL